MESETPLEDISASIYSDCSTPLAFGPRPVVKLYVLPYVSCSTRSLKTAPSKGTTNLAFLMSSVSGAPGAATLCVFLPQLRKRIHLSAKGSVHG